MKKALCANEPVATFFDFDDVPVSTAYANARDFCDCCPVRRGCLEVEMKLEGSEGLDHRYGIFAGLTPAQRHSLFKRGTALKCAECGESYDPVDLRQGQLSCSCGTLTTAPIPDRGDQWTDRHTKLARITIAWISDNVAMGGEMPDALALSRKLKVGVKDLRRVYHALIEDHVLLKGKGIIRRRHVSASAKQWTPVHLRDGTAS
jgi:hypothetical protein